MTNEVWAPVAGYEGCYEVSDLGNVRSLDRYVNSCRGSIRFAKGIQLRPILKRETGYKQVLLRRDLWLVHRLVAKAFCAGEAPGLVVDHINCDRGDNRAVNLRWLSHTENISRPYREDGLKGNALGKIGKDSTKPTPIVATCLSTSEVRRFDCASDAVRLMGFDSGAISHCCYGRQKSHKGWSFRFAEGVAGFAHYANRDHDVKWSAASLADEAGEIAQPERMAA